MSEQATHPAQNSPIERGHFDEAMADQAARDIYERHLIIFASDFTKAKRRRWPTDGDQGKRLVSSAMAMRMAAWCIHAFLGSNLEAFPSMAAIALRMNCGVRTAREAFGDLVTIGAASCIDITPGIASRRYALNYGVILRDFISKPGKALQALLDTPAKSAGVSDAPARFAVPPGEICRGARQLSQSPPAKSAAVNTPSKGPVNVSTNHHDGGQRASFREGGEWGSNRARSTDDFEASRQRTIDAIRDSEWRVKANAWALQAGVSPNQAKKRLAELSEDRFIEILHIIDDRKRAARSADTGSVDVPAFFVWLCKHPEVRRDNYSAKSGKRQVNSAEHRPSPGGHSHGAAGAGLSPRKTR